MDTTPIPQEAAQPKDDRHMQCWACLVPVQVPLVGEQQLPSPVFKCGWCGAITELFRGNEPHIKRRTLLKRVVKALSSLKWFVVAFVLLLTCSIILLGVAYVLPHTCQSTIALMVNHAITFLLTFNILFNYAASVLGSPGTVADCFKLHVKAGEPVPQGAYDNYRYCYTCKYYKPPEVHHCSTCQACVVDLDHHCPFLNNCVGRANMRNFLVFMFWTVAAMAFSLLHCGMLLAETTGILTSTVSYAWGRAGPSWDLVLFFYLLTVHLPAYMLATLYVTITAGGVSIGVGMLLLVTLRHVSRGTTYLGQLQATQGAAPAAASDTTKCSSCSWPATSTALANLQHVLGGRYILEWVWPVWGPPAGVIKGVKQD